MVVDIFIRTYAQDADKLPYVLRSISKFCEGVRRVHIVAPHPALPMITSAAVGHACTITGCDVMPNDYIWQQITKLNAFKYTDSDAIVFLDTDCLFFRPIDIQDELFEHGRPVLYHIPYQSLYEAGVKTPYQSSTSYILKTQINNEFMRSFPLVYLRQNLIDFNAWYVAQYDEPTESIYDRVWGPFRLSEFNLLGAFSYQVPDLYHSHVNQLERERKFWVRQFCREARDSRALSLAERDEMEALLTS